MTTITQDESTLGRLLNLHASNSLLADEIICTEEKLKT